MIGALERAWPLDRELAAAQLELTSVAVQLLAVLAAPALGRGFAIPERIRVPRPERQVPAGPPKVTPLAAFLLVSGGGPA